MDLAPLRQRNFGLLWWAGLVSLAGNWALNIAMPIFVLRLTQSPAAVSAVVAAGLFGNLVFGSVAGAYVDRWDRRRIVVVVNVLQTVVLAPLLLVDSAERVWIAVVVAFVESVLTQFFQPAENALLPRLVADQHLASANSLNSLNNYIGRLIGPIVGALAVAYLGLSGAALLDAGTFAIAAVLCGLITGTHRADRTGEPKRNLRRELAEGIHMIAGNRIVRAIAALIAVIMIGEGLMGTLFAVYVTRNLHGDGRELGWLMCAQAVGGIIGSLAATRVMARFHPVPLIATSFTFGGVMDLAIFNYPRVGTSLWPVLVMFLIIGAPIGIHVSALWTLFQVQTPDRLRGRTFATIWVGGALAGMLGAGIAGAFGNELGAVNLLTIAGVGLVVAGILFRVIAGPGPTSLANDPPEAREPTATLAAAAP